MTSGTDLESFGWIFLAVFTVCIDIKTSFYYYKVAWMPNVFIQHSWECILNNETQYRNVETYHYIVDATLYSV